MELNMNKVVSKLLQASVVAQTVLGGLNYIFQLQFPIVYVCQKLF